MSTRFPHTSIARVTHSNTASARAPRTALTQDIVDGTWVLEPVDEPIGHPLDDLAQPERDE